MTEHYDYDLVIIGMGSAGLTAAEFAAGLDLRVAVIERDRVGGDCLWTGCVPSKALLASAKAAHTIRHADRYGLTAAKPVIDLARVWRRIRAIQAEIAATDDNPQRYIDMGLDVIHGEATVTGANEVTVDHDEIITTRFILLCTGSRPVVPPIAGLTNAGFLTSESIFELSEPSASVAIIGGGPIAVEMAQAFARLGITTTVLQRDERLLPRDEPQLSDMLLSILRSEGVTVHLRAEVTAVRVDNGKKTVVSNVDGHVVYVIADDIVVAAGRQPNIESLGLANVGIEATNQPVTVDERGRTSVKSIYAVGDLAGRHLFTHSAGYEGVRAVRDMFFPGKGTIDGLIPWCTFTDPELAHAGLTVLEAEALYGEDTDVWQIGLDHNDRARAESAPEGALMIVTAKGRVVGAHVLAPAAGELIHELALAIRHEMKIDDIAQLVHIYPTLATSVGQLAAGAAFEKAQRFRWLVKRR
jgi:pyruvate/2-oxoglutarate dehydrogenase complex dihydrolipoamide dehydrogenase (E3) component